MANSGSGRSTGKGTRSRKTAGKGARSAAAEVERLTAEKEASEDKAFSLTHRVATLEGRERDLNELIIGHRERIAALQAERDALSGRLENVLQEADTLRQRERDLRNELAKLLARATSLEAERERTDRDLEAEKNRSGRLEQRAEEVERRADELDQQLGGARDRIAALESSRDHLNEELDSADQRSAELRQREADLTERIGAREARIADLNVEVDEERRRAGALEQKNAELSSRLEGRSERIADLEAGHQALKGELETARREIVALYERERDVQSRTVTLHEQVARLEVEGDMVKRALREERTAHSTLQQREAALRPQLESARARIRVLEAQHAEVDEEAERRERELREGAAQRERDLREGHAERERNLRHGAERREQELQERLEAVQEQIARVKAHRETLERTLTKEQGSRARLEKREAELADARQRITTLEAERDGVAAELENERKSLGELQEREGELQKELTAARRRESELQQDFEELGARESELQSTINGLREQVSVLEARRTNLEAGRADLEAERDRLATRLEQLESSRTYRMARFTWRVRKRIRHPFQRRARPVLTSAAKPSKRKKPAQLEKPGVSEGPAAAPASSEEPKLKPIPTPAMRKRAKPAAEKPLKPAPEPEPEPATEPQPQPATPVVTELDLERERWLVKAQAPPADVRQLRVAGVLDEMSAACFGPDCDLLRIDSEGWAAALEAHEPHLLLVESAWQGNNGSWQYMVASYTHPDYIGLPNLRSLIAWCRERDIPTVFWNKEDPVHFERFKEAAALFDYIFTSDANCIDRYAALEREGTGPISALQFAAQPRVHNPIGAPVERSTSPVFAGAYYRDRHIDRQKSLQTLLDAAMPFGLEIYDRRFGHEDKAFGFPERFTERVRGGLPYDEMIEAYKNHRVFLNVNSVHDSPTMFSRRVFELLACGTAVVSTESVGVEQTLGDVVSIVESSREATEALTKLQDEGYWRELTQSGRRRVLGEHTYRHRLAEVAGALGFNVAAYPGEEVAALALVDDVDQARRFRAVVASISAQETRPAELLIGSHTSVAGDLQELQADGSEIRVRVVQQDPDSTRSQRYRELAALAASPWLAIIHPAHTYGEHHITDLVLTTRFVDSDVIGSASFETTDGSGAVDRSLEHRFVDSVHPHSVLVRRDLAARRGWPDDVDGTGASLSDWFRQGTRIYSGDAGNFRADAALGLPGRAAAAGSERGPEG
jgi:predicted  nucleic acid-binding Zn-ribbon protein